MARVFNMLGGSGSKGLLPTIRTYAPSGSTLTCDGKSYTLKSGETYHDFVVSVNNTYTVTATLNGKTTSQNVTVDKVGLFTLQIEFIPTGATAYFTFNSNFNDSVSGSVGSSLVGSPTITSGGVFGDGCLYLNGSSALTIPYSSTLDLTTNGTVEFWAKITSNNSSGNNYLFGNPVRSGTFSNGYGLYICNNTRLDYGLRLAYGNGSSEKTVQFADINAVIDSVWHHWSLNRSGNTITIYKDGVLLSSVSASITLGTTAFLLGKSRDTADYLTGYFNDLLVVQGRTLRTGDFSVPTSHYLEV